MSQYIMPEEKIEWETYDPSWLVKLAKEQKPEQQWLAQALADCTKIISDNYEAYIHFVNPTSSWKLYYRNIRRDTASRKMFSFICWCAALHDLSLRNPQFLPLIHHSYALRHP